MINRPEKKNRGLLLTIVIAVLVGGALIAGFVFWDKSQNTSTENNSETNESASSNKTLEVAAGAKIQDAIDSAKAGDTIKVAAGTFSDGSTLNGLSAVIRIDKALTIEGAGRDQTILDGKDKVAYGIFVADGVDGKVVVKDMTIQNFETNGVQALNKEVEISGMTIADNGNQGAYFKGSTHDASFHNNIVTNNRFDGVYGERSGIQIYNNTIVANGTAGISFVLTDTATKATSPEMFNNIISDNAEYGILYGYPPYPKDAIVDHNNTFGNGKANYFQFKNNEHTKSGKVTPTPGTGELSQDPKFVDEIEYKLPAGSKLLTASRSGGEIGAYGVVEANTLHTTGE